MVEMFWCFSVKEATPEVRIAKSIIQVFNIYAVGYTATKKDYINGAIINIFIQPLIRDNKNLVWFNFCHLLNKNTVLKFVRSIILHTDFCLIISVSLVHNILVIFIWGTQAHISI